MKKGEKSKKASKKSSNVSKQKLEGILATSDEDMDVTMQESSETTKTDERNPRVIDPYSSRPNYLCGAKGHTTFYTKNTLDVGTYYFEIQLKACNQSIVDYLQRSKKGDDNKKYDEFTKKYYSQLTDNLKAYSSTVRVGVCLKDGDLDLPIGSHENSYAYRSSDGFLIHNGLYSPGNPSYSLMDTVGVLIHLKPPMPAFLKQNEVVEKNSKGIDKNPQCFIRFYLNGEQLENEFTGLWEGSYHICCTTYNFANCSLLFAKKDLKYFNKVEQEVKNVRPIIE